MNSNARLRRFCRFCIAGLGNTATHFVVAWSALEFAGLAVPTANLLGCVVATLLSYFLNSRFVFCEPVTARKLGRFALVNTGVLAFAYFAGVFVSHLNLPIVVAVIATSVFGVTIGFVAHSFVTFKRKHQMTHL